MKLFRIAGALVLLAGVVVGQQQPAAAGAQMGQQSGVSQPAGQSNAPATPAGTQTQGQQPATSQAPSGGQSGSQPASSTRAEAGQHPGFPAGPGMIEGCLSQAGNDYKIKPSEGGGPAFTLSLNSQTAENPNLKQDMANSAGELVKVCGYPAVLGGGSAAAGGEQTGPGGGSAGAGAQTALASASGASHTLDLTRFIPLNKPCRTGSSQAPTSGGSTQTATR